jgi:hypothetical protein
MEVGQGPNVGCSAKGKKIYLLVFIFMSYRYFFIFIKLIKIQILHETQKIFFLSFCISTCNYRLKCNIYFHIACILLQLVSHDLYTHRTDIIPLTSVLLFNAQFAKHD